MDLLNYLETIAGLRSVDRTVVAQEISPTDNGVLKYTTFFPPVDVPSTKLSEIIIDNKRFVASRREWNGPDRLIPVQKPRTLDLEMVPIGAYFTMGEQELQRYDEITDGEEQLILRRLGADVEGRTDGLVEAAYRRVDKDAFELWATGKVTQDDPTTGATVETDFEFDSDRYQDESGSAWDNTDFYDNLVAWATEAKAAIGGTIGGVMLSQTKRALVKASFTFPSGVNESYAYIEAALADELGVGSFRLVANDDTSDPFTDGGIATSNTRLWPATVVAAIPGDGRIGRTARAPIAGLSAMARQFPGAQIDRRGAMIAYTRHNDGKGVKVRSQLHHMSIPNESRLFVIDVGTP